MLNILSFLFSGKTQRRDPPALSSLSDYAELGRFKNNKIKKYSSRVREAAGAAADHFLLYLGRVCVCVQFIATFTAITTHNFTQPGRERERKRYQCQGLIAVP